VFDVDLNNVILIVSVLRFRVFKPRVALNSLYIV